MTTTLVVNNTKRDRKKVMEKLVLEHQDWNVIEAENHSDALSKIQTEPIDAMALDAELSCLDCLDLVTSLQDKTPQANIYMIMAGDVKADCSKSHDRGFIFI